MEPQRGPEQAAQHLNKPHRGWRAPCSPWPPSPSPWCSTDLRADEGCDCLQSGGDERDELLRVLPVNFAVELCEPMRVGLQCCQGLRVAMEEEKKSQRHMCSMHMSRTAACPVLHCLGRIVVPVSIRLGLQNGIPISFHNSFPSYLAT